MANERTEPLQLNLGSLRSAMSLTLHTHHASRIWHGRAPTEGRPGIIGLNGFIGAMNKMKRGAEQDDPYSDWWMLRIEDKLADTKTRLQTLREQVDHVRRRERPDQQGRQQAQHEEGERPGQDHAGAPSDQPEARGEGVPKGKAGHLSPPKARRGENGTRRGFGQQSFPVRVRRPMWRP